MNIHCFKQHKTHATQNHTPRPTNRRKRLREQLHSNSNWICASDCVDFHVHICISQPPAVTQLLASIRSGLENSRLIGGLWQEPAYCRLRLLWVQPAHTRPPPPSRIRPKRRVRILHVWGSWKMHKAMRVAHMCIALLIKTDVAETSSLKRPLFWREAFSVCFAPPDFLFFFLLSAERSFYCVWNTLNPSQVCQSAVSS